MSRWQFNDLAFEKQTEIMQNILHIEVLTYLIEKLPFRAASFHKHCLDKLQFLTRKMNRKEKCFYLTDIFTTKFACPDKTKKFSSFLISN